jgi:hypothetical protein
MSSSTATLRAWTFDDLVREGLSLIPAHAPHWTDHNPSDPGITLVELLAYFAEVLVYRLGRVTPDAKLQFLRLLKGVHWTGWRALQDDASHEAIDRALDDAVRELGHAQCAVTAADFEALATAAAVDHLGCDIPVSVLCLPGVDLERQRRGAPVRDARAHVTVVLLPRHELDAESMARLCSQVHAALLGRCLLTTRLHVVGPVALHLGIGCRLALSDGAAWSDVLRAIDDNLLRRFEPSAGAAAGTRRTGRRLRLTDITQVIDETDGVDYVEDVVVSSISHLGETLANPESQLGVQIGLHSTPGVDARLGVRAEIGGWRLERDDAGRLSAIALQPWEVARLRLASSAVHPIDAPTASTRGSP